MALGREEVGRAIVGAPGRVGIPAAPAEASRMVGAGAMLGGPAVRSGTVRAGAGARGAPPPMVGEGDAVGTGGLTGGAIRTVADGTAGGASAAFKITRTVSFFRGTLDVCLDGTVGWSSFSLMRRLGSFSWRKQVRQVAPALSNTQRRNYFRALFHAGQLGLTRFTSVESANFLQRRLLDPHPAATIFDVLFPAS